MTNAKKYNLDELKVGMQVRKSELSEIMDMYIVLANVKSINNDLDGTVGFIGKEITEEVAKLRNSKIPITCVERGIFMQKKKIVSHKINTSDLSFT